MSRKEWSDTGWFLEATGARDLFAKIGSIGGYSSRASLAWRGISSSDYALVSSLQRTHPQADESFIRAQELRLLEEARGWGLGFGPTGWSSDLQLLADLQHYGTSTRLLDVTSNPMTALWFACQEPARGAAPIARDGLLIAINTAGWKRFGKSVPAVNYAALGNPLTWELESALTDDEPFVVESLVPNERLRAQEGYFLAGKVPANRDGAGPFRSFNMTYQRTSSGEFWNALSHARAIGRSGFARLPFAVVSIPEHFKPRILQRLENSYNRHARVLFPDFAGFRDFGAETTPRHSPNAERSS